MEGFCCTRYVSGLALAVARDPEMERRHAQNDAMRELYEFGCRRLVAPKLMPRTGDGEKYLVRGFIV